MEPEAQMRIIALVLLLGLTGCLNTEPSAYCKLGTFIPLKTETIGWLSDNDPVAGRKIRDNNQTFLRECP